MKRHYIIFFIIALQTFAVISCKQNKPTSLQINKIKKDSTGIIYEFDTTKFIKHKSGFYLSKNKDVFQLNDVTYPDSTGFWSTHYWLDSLMFYGEYPDRKTLKETIDLETFYKDTLSRFEKDKKHVYYARATSDGISRFIVYHADPKTFKSISEKYGKDKSNVFYLSELVNNADLKSFQVIGGHDSAKDNKHIFYQGKKVE